MVSFSKRVLKIFLLWLSLAFQVLAFPYGSSNGFQESDLFTTTSVTFIQEAMYWNIQGLTAPSQISECGGMPVLGGPGVLVAGGYFEKRLYALPTHDTIYFRIELYIIDDWQSPDTIVIQFDGRNFTIGDISLSKPNFPSDLCGDSSINDLGDFYIIGRADHTASNVVLRIISAMSTPNSVASFGVRNINLQYGLRQAGEPGEMSCNIAQVPIVDNSCACPAGNYQNPLNPSECLPCHPNCADCFGPAATECFACSASAGSSYVNNECISCSSQCTFCYGPGDHQCYRCADTAWHKWDTSCPVTCDSPAYAQEIQGDVKLCKPPCYSGVYYLSNQSCSGDCPSPLGQWSNNFGKFCNLACPVGSEYLHDDGSCLSTCDPPLVAKYKDNVILTCTLPCPTGEKEYPNGTCSSALECDFPLVEEIDGSVEKCVSPCNNTNKYFYEPNNTCLLDCPSPSYTQEITDFYIKCVLVITVPTNNTNNNTTNPTKNQQDQKDIKFGEKTASALQIGGRTLTAGATVTMLFGATNPAAGTLAGFVKMLPYIRYINISYPLRLQTMLDNMNSTMVSFDFGFSMPKPLQQQFTKRPLPHKFDRYQFHSSFLVNYWKVASALAILLTIITMLCILPLMAKNQRVQTLSKGLKLILKWNFFLMIFCTNLDGIVIGTSLELRTVHFDSFTGILSFLFCIFMNVVSIVIFALAFYIIRDLRKSKRQVFSEKHESKFAYFSKIKENGLKKWQEYQLFYKGSRDKTFAQSIFMLPYLARIYLFNFMIANVYSYPLTQAIVITSLSVFMILYIQLTRPFVSKLVFCQHSTDEAIMLIVNSCMLGLAICDAAGQDDLATRNALGNAIIYCNVAFSATANIYTVSYLYVGFKSAYDTMKKSKDKGALAYLTALLAPYEIGGMDVDADAEAVGDVKMETNSPLPRVSPLLLKLNEDGANSGLLANDARRLSLRIQQQHTSFNSNSDIKDSQEAIENLLLPMEKTTSRPQSPSNYLAQPEAISPQRLSSFGLNARRSIRLGSHLESKVDGDLQSSDIFEDLTKTPDLPKQRRLISQRLSHFRSFETPPPNEEK